MTISNESYSQSFTGDQEYQCIVRVPDQTPRIRNVTIQGIAKINVLHKII